LIIGLYLTITGTNIPKEILKLTEMNATLDKVPIINVEISELILTYDEEKRT
jgi:hypothetical protein